MVFWLSVGFLVTALLAHIFTSCPWKPLRRMCRMNHIEGTGEDLDTYLVSNRATLKEQLAVDGYLLFRDFRVNPSSYLLEKLGYVLPNRFLYDGFKGEGKALLTILGRQPRTFWAPGIFRSTTLPASRIILPHTELAFMGDGAPATICFHVLSHKSLSETPLIDMEGLVAVLREEHRGLYTLLKESQAKMSYTLPYTIPGWKRTLMGWVWSQKPKTVFEAFDMDDLESIVRVAQEKGFEVVVGPQAVTFSKKVSPISSDGKHLAWCSDFWGHVPFWTALWGYYGSRFSLIEKLWWSVAYWFRKASPAWDPDPTRGTIEGLSANDISTLTSLMFDPRFHFAFQWRRGDVLILDNKRIGHSRAPRGAKVMTAMYGYEPKENDFVRTTE